MTAIKGAVATCLACGEQHGQVTISAPDQECLNAVYGALTIHLRSLVCLRCRGQVTWDIAHTAPDREIVEAMRGPRVPVVQLTPRTTAENMR